MIDAYSSNYGARIRLLYKDANNVTVNFASLFIALDLLDKGDYGSFTRPFIKLSKTPPGQIIFPNSTNPNSCPTLKDFLPIAFPQKMVGWQMWDNPTCVEDGTSANRCIDVQIGGKPYPEKQTSETCPKYTDDCKFNPLYWRFNGRTHTIGGAIRFLIKLPSGDPGYLIIGYGGNGGAG